MFLLTIGVLTLVFGLAFFLYGTVAPVEKAVDGWFYKMRARRIDKRVNGD